MKIIIIKIVIIKIKEKYLLHEARVAMQLMIIKTGEMIKGRDRQIRRKDGKKEQTEQKTEMVLIQ